jgi:opacity protein-like surface antigen
MRRFLLLAVIILAPAIASAQTVELFGMTGGGHVWDDEGRIGFGMPVGGGAGFRLPNGWGIEGLFETQKAERNFSSGVRFDSTVTAARARVLKYFGDGRVRPYAGGGIGISRIESTRTEPPGLGGVFSSAKTSRMISGVAGVRIPAGNRLFVRPEFEVSRAGEHLRMAGNVSVGIGW